MAPPPAPAGPAGPAGLVRASLYLRQELLVGPAVLGRSQRRQQLIRRVAAAHLARQVPDRALRARLRPDYAIGCKRILVSDDYYPALSQPNVEVIGAAVRELLPDAVVDEHGGARQVDAVVLGTGFRAAEPSFAARIHGRDGRPLSATWSEGMAAYLGSTVPGFPNLFLLVGPNTVLGHNSMVYMIESQLRYVLSALEFLGRPGWARSRCARRCWPASRRVYRRPWPRRRGSPAAAPAGISTAAAATPPCGPVGPTPSGG